MPSRGFQFSGMHGDRLNPTQILVRCDPYFHRCWVDTKLQQPEFAQEVQKAAPAAAVGKQCLHRDHIFKESEGDHLGAYNFQSCRSTPPSVRVAEESDQLLLMTSRVSASANHMHAQKQQSGQEEFGYSIRASSRASSSSRSGSNIIHNQKGAGALRRTPAAMDDEEDNNDDQGIVPYASTAIHHTAGADYAPSGTASDDTGGQNKGSTHVVHHNATGRVWKFMCSSVLLLCSITVLLLLLPLVLPAPLPPPPLELLLLPLFILLLLMYLALSPTFSPALPSAAHQPA